MKPDKNPKVTITCHSYKIPKMKHLTILLTLLMSCGIFSQKRPVLIPMPHSLEWRTGQFELTAKTDLLYEGDLENEARYLADILNQATGFEMEPQKEGKENKNPILLKIDPTIEENKEAYQLKVTTEKVTLIGASPTGVFRGIQTLLQLLPPAIYGKQKSEESWKIPVVSITDKPQFQWRGMLLDCSRHFMEKDFVKRYIDLLAYHKMNTLHWHITEDQGWRIEIKKYPKLTEVGAWRTEKDGTRYGGFYTQEEIKEIVQYAVDRHINVVPEIELPGHSQAALAAYPEYSCTGGPFEVETEWGVFREIYCAGNDGTFEFLENILTEVIELFPSPYIHIGGDEVPKYRWEQCAKCQKRMKDEKLHDTHELQSYFIKRIEKFLAANHKRLIGWDEILEGGLAEGAIVQSWRGMNGAIEAIKTGHPAIVSPTSHAYFDYDLKSIDLEKVYSFDPIPKEADEEQKALIWGGECNMWSERAPQELVDSKVFPRILAMTEVLWTYPMARDYEQFYQRVQRHYPRLKVMGVQYGFETMPVHLEHYFQPDGSAELRLNAGTPELKLCYTLDGTTPNEQSKIYRIPIEPKDSCFVKVQAYKEGKTYGEVFEQAYEPHQVLGKQADLLTTYSSHYTGGGDKALVNGLRGSTDFRDGNWQGYQYDDLVVVFDLRDQELNFSEVSVGFYQYNNSWIFLPKMLMVEVSQDGKNFKQIAHVDNEISPKQRGKFLHELQAKFSPQSANYLRVTAKNIQYCPDWHEAAGSKAWLFVDEILVK